MKFPGWIWDVDGTLFDTYPAFVAAFSQALAEMNALTPINRVAQLAKISLGYATKVLASELELDAEQLDRRFWERYDRIPLANQPLFPGAASFLSDICARGGQNLIVTHRSRSSTAELLGAYGLSDSISAIISVNDGYPRKPDPAMFHAALEHLKWPAAQVMSVGDREIDMQAGAAAGVKTCLFGKQDGPVQADYYAANFADLRSRLLDGN